MAMRTRLSSTSASAEIFWTWRKPSMYGKIWAGQGWVSGGGMRPGLWPALGDDTPGGLAHLLCGEVPL